MYLRFLRPDNYTDRFRGAGHVPLLSGRYFFTQKSKKTRFFSEKKPEEIKKGGLKMKYAMVGAGAAGSCFASYLRRGGLDITLVDRYKEHMDKVAAEGMDFTVNPDKHYHVDGFKTATSAEGIGIMDAVIFMTKATQVESALETAKPCIGPETVLVSLMNGIGNEDYLLPHAAPDRVIFGSGVMGTFLAAPGVCAASPGKEAIQMNFGPVNHGEKIDAVGAELEKCFTGGGCPAKYWDDVRPKIWWKAADNCIFNSLTAMLRLKSKYLYDLEDGWPLIQMMAGEICDVAKAKGVDMDVQKYLDYQWDRRSTPIKNYYPSMAQDMLIHERQTEITTMNGAIARMGKEMGVPTPLNTIISHMISLTQKNYEHLYPKEK